jgi:hypothetical protein
MKCSDFERLMPDYWEHQLTDIEHYQVEQHMKHCPMCRNEYALWEESERLIRNSNIEFESKPMHFTISQDVMSRIYAENPWATPASKKPFHLSRRLRGWMSGISAALFIVFMAGFFLSASMPAANPLYGEDIFSKQHHMVGIQPVGSASASLHEEHGDNPFYGVVASVGEPVTYNPMNGITGKTYVIALFLLGASIMVLGMTWLARVRG